MRVASKVIFLYRDANGFGTAIANSLKPNPNSGSKRIKSSFDLSLERYGIHDTKASGNIIDFVDAQGATQVTILLMQNYEPPIAGCAVNEVLKSITQESGTNRPLLMLPYIVSSSKLEQKVRNLGKISRNFPLYGIKIGPDTDSIASMVDGLPKPPSTLPIHDEILACLLQFVRVLRLETVFLVAPTSGSNTAAKQEREVLSELGEFLASRVGLSFSKECVEDDRVEKANASKEDWRALYG
ncbi:hypothetical protein AMTRI_Chr10g7750 [Amborella trichopoda]|uniref:DUF7894 domain-containing protein n=1 Tax=Amborella trichopoda TaxID=13333 RepID=U5D9J8_AMBTC|nr:uncharacterized protein LOC18447543 isoform X2 [Amborella trichopoda]ERN19169.1 hypothetical protein AMTR_s00061p00169900 [Amborella trichopoda]|eukprot:XP_006857702.1 uncharacterized protein LOC18447543 isoform X2 [Amborella trichopoda]